MKKNAGNALVLILLAVALLGLLTALLMRTSSTTEETGETERETIRASEIVRYGAGLTAIANNLLMRGCSESEISFEVEDTDGFQNPNSPGDESCHLFKPAGGGGKRVSSFGGVDYTVLYNGRINVQASRSTRSDIVMLILNVPDSLCFAINRLAKVDSATIPIDAGAAAGVTSTPFAGTLYDSGTNITNEGTAVPLYEKKTGCVNFASRSMNVFYNIIVDR